MTEDGLFTFYASLGGDAGFDTARLVRPGWDEENGPQRRARRRHADHLHRRHVGRRPQRHRAGPQRRGLLLAEHRLRPVRGQGDHGPRAALRQRGAVRPAPDPAGRHRRVGHRRPALRRRGRRDRLVQPVGQRLVGAGRHRRVPRGRPAEHGAGDRPARHRHRLPGLVLAAARRGRGAAAVRRPDGRPEAAPDDRRAQQSRRGDPGQLRAVDPVLRRRRDRGHAVGDPAAVSRAGGGARRDDRLDRPEPAGHALRLPSRLLRRRTSASSAASAWSSSGTPRSSAPTPPSTTATSSTGTSSPGRRRC